MPTGITAAALSTASIRVAWGASTDDTGVIGYRLHRSGVSHHDCQVPGFVDTALSPGATYCYTVLAYDAAGNDSVRSEQACATTPTSGYALGVSTAGPGAGTVTSSPAGIDCGADCSETYTSGTSVTLTASPTVGSTVASWSGCDSSSGNTCEVSMTGDKAVTATFDTAPVHSLSVSTAGTGAGTVTSSPAGIDCGGDCSEPYTSGTDVTLTASAATGSALASWSGCDSASGNTCVVSMTGDKTVTATFKQKIVLRVASSNLIKADSRDPSVADTAFPDTNPAVGTNSSRGVAQYFAGVVRFDVAQLAGKKIESATLRVTTRTAPDGRYPEDWQLAAILTPWKPSTVTWNAMQSLKFGPRQDFRYPTRSPQTYEIDVKTIVQNWADATSPNYGIAFASTAYRPPGTVASLDAYEFVPPTLTVTYD